MLPTLEHSFYEIFLSTHQANVTQQHCSKQIKFYSFIPVDIKEWSSGVDLWTEGFF